MVKPWPRLPREVVEAPPLETFKTRLNGALSSLTQVKMSLLTAGELGWVASEGPFQPKASYASILCHCTVLIVLSVDDHFSSNSFFFFTVQLKKTKGVL